MKILTTSVFGFMTRCFVAFLLLGAPAIFGAEWQAEEIANSDGSGISHIAVVENPAGYRLEFTRDDNDIIHGYFTLRDGFDIFTKASCPTFRVDNEPALNLAEHAAPCEPKSNRTKFFAGRIENNQVESPLLLQLMNGTQVIFRFHLENVGYQETRFRLKRSKKALRNVIGAQTKVVIDQNE
ncbi:MAG: hypothetical protein GY731_04930 [Gammaproteobacteria bacterium]|nr:hypothetical protein [Gammaproteobacteria bacterium]